MWRVRPDVLIAALWASFAARLVRKRLRRHGIAAHVPRPPHLGATAGKGVSAALSRLHPTCLERALVLQAWFVRQGQPRDVVIGIPRSGMRTGPAHAWVDGTDRSSVSQYLELHRLPPRPRTTKPL